MNCGLKILKYLLFFFNFLFFILGTVLIIVGSLVVAGKISSIETINFVNTVGWLCIALGIIIFLISFCGCCGACMESRVLLVIYLIFVVLSTILAFAFAICAAVMKGKINDSIDELIKKAVNEYDKKDKMKEVMDGFQTGFKCCGISGKSDWDSRGTIPDSCKKSNTPNDYYDKGCASTVIEFIKSKFSIFLGVLFGVAFFQFLIVVSASCVCHAIGKDSQHA
jgi:CD63 antigen